jgi:hypothetical protein
MSSGYSSVTADPSYKLLQSSLPYCVFRNKQRYHLLPPSSDKTDGGQAYHQHETAEAQTKLLLTSAAGQFVPSYLTYGTIRLEMQNLPPVGSSPLHNTVISLQYDQLNLFVHPGGRYLDELVLRDVHHTFRGEDLDRPPGFTLPLSKGSQLREVAFAGTTHWGTKSQLLARAGSEIYHVRTLGLDEYRSIPATESEAEQGHRHMYETSPVILEPTQKWQLPTEISSMACSTTGWSTAGVLGANGAYFTWTPTDGIKSFHGGKSVLPHTEEKGYMKDFTRRTECSWHPQVHYLTSQESLYTLDLRSQSMAVALYSAAGPVLSPKQHDRQASLLLVSVKDAVQLVDVRYPKGCVAQQYVPHGHQLMASVQTPYTNSTAGELRKITSRFCLHGTSFCVSLHMTRLTFGCYYIYRCLSGGTSRGVTTVPAHARELPAAGIRHGLPQHPQARLGRHPAQRGVRPVRLPPRWRAGNNILRTDQRHCCVALSCCPVRKRPFSCVSEWNCFCRVT